MTKKRLFFRAWYYFRQGWSTYFAFIFAAINTMTTTYYLAVNRYPPLLEIFPSFTVYVGFFTLIGIPILIVIGYLHYKKTAAYTSEAEIIVESNPYHYRLPRDGWNTEVVFPLYMTITNMMIKWSKNEKLTEQEIAELQSLQEKINTLIKGGFVGNPKKKVGL